MASILQFSTGGLRLISRPTLEDHNHSHRVVYIGCSGPSGRGRAFGKGWRVPTSIASGNEESSLAAVPGLAKEDASLAAYDFMERVRTADVTMEELKRIAPVYQKAHELYVREVAQKIDSLQEERVNLIKELRSADLSMADYKQMVAGDMDMVRICVEQQRQCANLGMRIIVETALRDFNFKHLNGDCQDQTCRDYISSLLSKQQLTKHGRSRTIKKDGQSVQIQPYVFNTNEWSRPETIKHMAECPHATLLTQHNDALGNTLLSMSLADLKAEIRSRANPLWDQLHAPHHLLDATATRLTLKLAYGPGTSRADTLFYLSMCQAAKVAVSVTSPEAAISDVGASLRHLRDSVRGRV